MSYAVELIPLKATTPPLESLDEETKTAWLANHLGLYGMKGVDEGMRHYDEKVRIEMHPIDEEYERPIWRVFLSEVFEDDEFAVYPSSIPTQVLEHCKKARDLGVFFKFEIWTSGDRQKEDCNCCLTMLIGCCGTSSYILARWQPESEEPVTLGLIKRWIREGLYPKIDRPLIPLNLEETIKSERRNFNYCCDQHDKLIGKPSA